MAKKQAPPAPAPAPAKRKPAPVAPVKTVKAVAPPAPPAPVRGKGRPAGTEVLVDGTVMSLKIPGRLYQRLEESMEYSGFTKAEILRQGLDARLSELESRRR